MKVVPPAAIKPNKMAMRILVLRGKLGVTCFSESAYARMVASFSKTLTPQQNS